MTGRHAGPPKGKRRRKETEDDEFAKAAGRFIAALERRASTNPDALAYMLTLRDEMSGAIDRAGHRLTSEAGFSLTEIATFLGFAGHPMTRQNAAKRWGAAAMARKLGVPSITARINEQRERSQSAAAETFGTAYSDRVRMLRAVPDGDAEIRRAV